MADEWTTLERSYRGISVRLAVQYLTSLGGEAEGEGYVVADDWEATLSTENVSVGPSLDLTQVDVVFRGDPETLDALVERFSQKAMRAGG